MSEATAGIDSEAVKTELYTVAGSKWTFDDKEPRRWVESKLRGRVLNACAGESRLRYGGEIVRNDLDDSITADYHCRVRDLPEVIGHDEFDTIVYDPPWSVYQSNEEYEGRMIGTGSSMAEALHKLLRSGGQVIGFGYRATVMPADLGYKRQEVAIFNTIGRTRDFFGVRDLRVNSDITEWGGKR